MSKSTHLIPVEVSYLAEDFVKLYLKEIIGGHRVPLSIISDFGTQFTVQLLKSFKKGFLTRVMLSTTFHYQKYSLVARKIQALAEMLRSYAIDFKGN